MAQSYTPGLRVAESTLITKDRILPLKGDVLAKEGEHLEAEKIVARTELPGNVTPLNAANILGCSAADVGKALLIKPGDKVMKEQVIAESKSMFGLFKNQLKAPVSGSLESYSEVTGQLIFRDPPIPVEIDAYVDGRVTEVFPREGIEIQAQGALVQGIFGIGGETFGYIHMCVTAADEILDESKIPADCKGKILVGGSVVTLPAVRKAIANKASAMVVGGFSSMDLKTLLGYEQGVAITGSEQIGLTLILTEGFGQIAMAGRTFKLLAKHEGHKASCSGATQIRAGVLRPEIIISKKDVTQHVNAQYEIKGLEIGTTLRVIREPHFGRIGKATSLPAELIKLDTETMVRCLEIQFEGLNEKFIIPRANVEVIED